MVKVYLLSLQGNGTEPTDESDTEEEKKEEKKKKVVYIPIYDDDGNFCCNGTAPAVSYVNF